MLQRLICCVKTLQPILIMHIPTASYPYHHHTEPLPHPQVTPLTYHHKHFYDPVVFLALNLLAASISLAIIAHCIKTMRAEIARITESVTAEKREVAHRRLEDSYLSGVADEQNDFASYPENVAPNAAVEMDQG